MPKATTMHLDGGEELVAALQRLDLTVKRELRSAGLAGADVIKRVANARAPGPHIETAVSQSTGSKVVVDIGPDATHWFYRFHETGAAAHEIQGAALLAFEGRDGTVITPRVSHPGMPASPFLRPAFDEKKDAARDAMGDALRARIAEVKA